MCTNILKVLLGLVLMGGMIAQSYGDEVLNVKTHHYLHHEIEDGRVSLNISEKMKQHQLVNMRSHLEAVQAIVGFIAEGQFQNASVIAHKKLGLTDEMKSMCSMFDNKTFESLGLSFHKSADTLGDVLLTKDIGRSLDALNTTLGYCTQCHSAFKQ